MKKNYKDTFNNAASNFIVDLEDFCWSGDLCISCKHLQSDKYETGCDAFPNRSLPDDILLGPFIHTKRHPEQDNDILYEAIE